MAYNTRKMLEDSNGDLIPQYFNQQADVYEHLRGAQGVNFVGNHVLTDSGIWVPQRGTEDGAAHTQLTGSNLENVEVRKLVDAQAIADVGDKAAWLDESRMKNYKAIDFHVHNTHDVPIRFSFRFFSGTINSTVLLENGDYVSYGGYNNQASHVVPPNTSILLSHIPAKLNNGDVHTVEKAPFKNFLGGYLTIRYRADTAPTEGQITVNAIGVM